MLVQVDPPVLELVSPIQKIQQISVHGQSSYIAENYADLTIELVAVPLKTVKLLDQAMIGTYNGLS